MRLKNIYITLKEVEPTIIKIKSERIDGSNDYIIKSWVDVLEVIEKIKKIEIFDGVGQEIFKISPIFGERIEHLRIISGLVTPFNNWLNNIKTKMDAIIELCESLGYGENEGSFEVKLPETNDLKDFSSNITNLNRVFQICPFMREEDSQIQLIKTDIGSTWIEFCITGIKAASILTGLGYIVQSALKIKSMYYTCEQQKEMVRGAQTKNNLAETIANTYQEMINAAASNEVKALEEKLDRPLNAEERNSAEKSIEILGELMSKGLEIYATLDSPQEARDVFPDMQEQNFLPGMIKMLTDNSKEK